MKRKVENIIWSDQFSGPARVNHLTGEMQLNKDYASLPPELWDFIIAHEEGHLVKNTRNEFEADNYAFEKLAGKKKGSLKAAVDSFLKVFNLGNLNTEQKQRIVSRVQLVALLDIQKFQNSKAFAILDKANEMAKSVGLETQHYNPMENTQLQQDLRAFFAGLPQNERIDFNEVNDFLEEKNIVNINQFHQHYFELLLERKQNSNYTGNFSYNWFDDVADGVRNAGDWIGDKSRQFGNWFGHSAWPGIKTGYGKVMQVQGSLMKTAAPAVSAGLSALGVPIPPQVVAFAGDTFNKLGAKISGDKVPMDIAKGLLDLQQGKAGGNASEIFNFMKGLANQDGDFDKITSMVGLGTQTDKLDKLTKDEPVFEMFKKLQGTTDERSGKILGDLQGFLGQFGAVSHYDRQYSHFNFGAAFKNAGMFMTENPVFANIINESKIAINKATERFNIEREAEKVRFLKAQQENYKNYILTYDAFKDKSLYGPLYDAARVAKEFFTAKSLGWEGQNPAYKIWLADQDVLKHLKNNFVRETQTNIGFEKSTYFQNWLNETYDKITKPKLETFTPPTILGTANPNTNQTSTPSREVPMIGGAKTKETSDRTNESPKTESVATQAAFNWKLWGGIVLAAIIGIFILKRKS